MAAKFNRHFVGFAKRFQQFSLGVLEQLQMFSDGFHYGGEVSQAVRVHADILVESKFCGAPPVGELLFRPIE